MSDRQDPDKVERELVGVFLKTRNEGVFRQMHTLYSPRLYALALRLLGGSRDEAKDAVQETWIQAVQKLGSFEWRSTLGTWLSGILINRCRGMIRRGRPREMPLLEVVEAGSASRPDDVSLRIDLERAVRELPDGCREIFVLYDIEGYTHPEIAELLGVTVGTSKSQLSRARGKLRDHLGRTERMSNA